MWKPIEINSVKKERAYKIYQFIWGSFHFAYTSCMIYTIIKMVVINKRYSEYYQTVYFAPITLLLLLKFVYVIYKRDKLIQLIDYFTLDEFTPLNDYEREKEAEYEKLIR